MFTCAKLTSQAVLQQHLTCSRVMKTDFSDCWGDLVSWVSATLARISEYRLQHPCKVLPWQGIPIDPVLIHRSLQLAGQPTDGSVSSRFKERPYPQNNTEVSDWRRHMLLISGLHMCEPKQPPSTLPILHPTLPSFSQCPLGSHVLVMSPDKRATCCICQISKSQYK